MAANENNLPNVAAWEPLGTYLPTCSDGREAEVLVCRMPAAFYRVRSEKAKVDLTTGSGEKMRRLAAQIAQAIADGMLGAFDADPTPTGTRVDARRDALQVVLAKIAHGPGSWTGIGQEPRIEAREFLGVAGGFANNHFGGDSGNANALGFVERLYAAGATKVEVAGILAEPGRIKRDGGPYADTLIVSLPNDEVMNAVANLAAGEGSDELTLRRDEDDEDDVGTYRIWWD